MVNLKLSSNAPSPRLCVVKKSVDHQEYGFNLHAERGKGQFVGVVDDGSPAQKAGLKSGDRIFAVNGEGIVGDSHKEVVHKIKSNPLQCELLVISEEGAQWYQERGIPINNQMTNVIRTCEEPIYSDVTAYHFTVSPAPWEMQTSPVVVSKMKAQLKFSDGDARRSVFPSNVRPSSDDVNLKSFGMAAASVPGKTGDDRTPPKNNNGAQNSIKSPPSKTKTPGSISMPPRPRLCTLVKQGPVHEFGFNLHAERGKGHFIGNVDKDGIADRAGLETGQRIVGVNGQLIYPNTPHKDVVALIKRDPLSTELLVASEEIDRWYTETGTPFSYDRVTVFEADNKAKAPSSTTGNISHQNFPSEMFSGYGKYDSRPVAKSNGSASAQGRCDTVVSDPEPLQTTYVGEVNGDVHPIMRPSSTAIVVCENHMTSIHVDSALEDSENNGGGNQNSKGVYRGQVQPSGSPDALLEKVFSRVKPPAVHTSLHQYQGCNENHDNAKLEGTTTKELLVARNGHKLVEQTNKHVIATSAPSPVLANGGGNKGKPVPLIVSPYSSEKKPAGVPMPALRDFPSPVSTDSHSVTLTGSMVKDENKDIFKLSAKDARQLMKQKKKDPRMQNMSLEEKYNVIANL